MEKGRARRRHGGGGGRHRDGRVRRRERVGDQRGCREADIGGRRRRRRTRHQRSCGDLVSREVRRGVRGRLARGPHADAERRFSVPSLGWRLRRRARVQGEGSGLAAVAAQFVGATAKPTPPRGRPSSRGATRAELADGNGIAFFVPAGAGSVFNFSLPRVPRSAVGGGGSRHTIWARRRRSSPTARSPPRARRAAVNGVKATITYSVTGRFGGSPRPERRRRPACTAKTSCSRTRPTASARQTTRPGRRLDLNRPEVHRARHLLGRESQRQRRHVPCPGWRRESAELHDPEIPSRLCRRRWARRSHPDPAGDDQA